MRRNWAEFDGGCALEGFDPKASTLGRVLNVAFVLMLRNCETEEEQKEIRSLIYSDATLVAEMDEDELPEWARGEGGYVPPWFSGTSGSSQVVSQTGVEEVSRGR